MLFVPLSPLASASFVEYTDQVAWNTAVPSFTTIQFSEVPLYSSVTDQYAPLGVIFTPGDDWTDFNPALWPSDGFGLRGGFTQSGNVLPIIMEFETPLTSLAIRYPGSTKFLMFSGGIQIGETNSFYGFNPWSFAGIVSDTPFDKLIISNTTGGANSMDTLYFGGFVPAPGTAVVLALGGAALGLRRRSRRRGDLCWIPS
jgi:hypothetical protein